MGPAKHEVGHMALLNLLKANTDMLDICLDRHGGTGGGGAGGSVCRMAGGGGAQCHACYRLALGLI